VPLGLLGELARHTVDFWLTTEDLPDPENRVTVDKSGNITLSYTPNNKCPGNGLYELTKKLVSTTYMSWRSAKSAFAGRPFGEGHLHDVLVSLAGADQSAVPPHRNAPLLLLAASARARR